jgi:hypothetical protein
MAAGDILTPFQFPSKKTQQRVKVERRRQRNTQAIRSEFSFEEFMNREYYFLLSTYSGSGI